MNKMQLLKILEKIALLMIIIGLMGGILSFVDYSNTNKAKANIFDTFTDFFKTRVFVPVDSQKRSDLDLKNNNEQIPLYKPVIDYEKAVIEAVEKVQPSVVSIIVSKYLSVIEQCPFGPFIDLPPGLREFFDFNIYVPCDKGKKELKEIGGGSGFIVSSDGLIVTNKHVVSDKQADYTVLTNDGKKYDAKVLALDPTKDIALLKINASNLKYLTLGDSDNLKLGQTVIAIGNALGEFRNTVSVGVVSGLSRNIRASGNNFSSELLMGVIQTDAAINPGNSGGPLLNLKGEVVGINTAVVVGAENIGFAIPINQVKNVINSVKETGRIQIPYLGVRYFLINEELAKKEKLSVNYGALVRGNEDGPAVIKGSPAEKAGLLAEDIILEVNGEKITQDNPLALVIQKYGVGQTLTLRVLRKTNTLEIKVVLEERPSDL